MKYFLVIFSVYFLALSLMPCTDALGMNTPNTSKTEITQTHNNDTDHNDFCSPFCICSCCNTPVNITFDLLSIKVNNPIASNLKISVFNFSLASNYYGSIWQPPKIS